MKPATPQTSSVVLIVLVCALIVLLASYSVTSCGCKLTVVASLRGGQAATKATTWKTTGQENKPLSLGQLPLSNASCTGQGEGISCAATWACLEANRPTTLYGGLSVSPVQTYLRSRWSNKAPPVLTLLPHKELQARGHLANSSVHVIKGTSVLHKRLAVGNFGHLLLENLIPLIRGAQSVDPNFSLKSTRVLLLDDCNNTADFDLLWRYPSTPANCFDRYAELVHQLEPSASMAVLSDVVPQGVDLVCFERAIFGIGGTSGLFEAKAPAHLKAVELFRSYWDMQLVKLRQPRQGLQVVIHAKERDNRHGAAILNAPELCKALQANISTVNCTVFSLDALKTVSQQLQLFANADVFVSDTGSSQYYALFMPAGGLHISTLTCRPANATQACMDVIAGNMICGMSYRATMESFTNVKSILLPAPSPSDLSWYKGTYRSAWSSYNASCAPNSPASIARSYDVNLPTDAVVQLVSQHLATRAG